ncbi:DUF397 domain-containing protein [Streptomyces koyangensis]|uniref:DUF397 domain-containing protein n=1 Tax=Streptomyces koyangensis TaxID=188770 RepID=A0ABX7EDQ4_9ACTN|nr:DUF397 domain-containing protein [Streptomyces koyangensis]QRF02320.1 DUF397 domain-containing protein [Streptomyces koyangensis]
MTHVADSTTLAVTWRKSSASHAQSDCVECAVLDPHHRIAALRDSKAPTGPALLLPYDTLNTFVAALKQGALK